ncbi:unnamed protein product [Lampetra planeri]
MWNLHCSIGTKSRSSMETFPHLRLEQHVGGGHERRRTTNLCGSRGCPALASRLQNKNFRDVGKRGARVEISATALIQSGVGTRAGTGAIFPRGSGSERVVVGGGSGNGQASRDQRTSLSRSRAAAAASC